MTDQLISLETAKLAKEKGFANEFDWLSQGSFPTQSLLQKWLRETYGLSVEVNFNIYLAERMNGWYWRIVFTKHYIKSFTNLNIVNNTCCYIGSKANSKDLFTPYSEYEEALEVALQEALKLIP
jgi:hypothetical protein